MFSNSYFYIYGLYISAANFTLNKKKTRRNNYVNDLYEDIHNDNMFLSSF